MSWSPRIDFVSASDAQSWLMGTRRRRFLRGIYTIGLLGLLAVAAGVAWRHAATLSETAALQSRIENLAARPRRAATPMAASILTPGEERSLTELTSRLNFDWNALLDELERRTPPGVALLEIEPKPGQGMLELTMEASSVNAVLQYVDALNQSGHWRGARLTRHESDARDPSRPARFVVSVALATAARPAVMTGKT